MVHFGTDNVVNDAALSALRPTTSAGKIIFQDMTSNMKIIFSWQSHGWAGWQSFKRAQFSLPWWPVTRTRKRVFWWASETPSCDPVEKAISLWDQKSWWSRVFCKACSFQVVVIDQCHVVAILIQVPSPRGCLNAQASRIASGLILVTVHTGSHQKIVIYTSYN